MQQKALRNLLNLCEHKTKKIMDKIKLQKSKLELHLHEFRSILYELMRTDNHNNKTDHEKEYEHLDDASDAAMIILMERNDKTEFMN